MASILQFPSTRTPGLLALTSIEYGRLTKIERQLIAILRSKDWLIAYHENDFRPPLADDPLIDVYLAPKSLFSLADGMEGKIIDLCCENFVPSHFVRAPNEHSFDFVHVTRFQRDKNLMGMFRIVKNAFQHRPQLTGVVLVSVPGKRPSATRHVRDQYKKIFTPTERSQFDLITVDYDLPFPLSSRVISSLYSRSRVHLNTHLREKSGRAQAYALALGMPVVGFANLTQLVPSEFRRTPFYFVGTSEVILTERLIEAIDYVETSYEVELHSSLASKFLAKNSFLLLQAELESRFPYAFPLNEAQRDDLDIYLAKHHDGSQSGSGYAQPLRSFLIELVRRADSGSFVSVDEMNNLYVENEGPLIRARRRQVQMQGRLRRQTQLAKHEVVSRFPMLQKSRKTRV